MLHWFSFRASSADKRYLLQKALEISFECSGTMHATGRMCRTSARTGRIISGSHIRHQLPSAEPRPRGAPHCRSGKPSGNPRLYPPAQGPSVVKSAPSNAVRNGARRGTGHWIGLSSRRGQCYMCASTHTGCPRICSLKQKYLIPGAELSQFPQTKNRRKKLRLSNIRLSGKKINFPNWTIIS